MINKKNVTIYNLYFLDNLIILFTLLEQFCIVTYHFYLFFSIRVLFVNIEDFFLTFCLPVLDKGIFQLSLIKKYIKKKPPTIIKKIKFTILYFLN